MSASIAGLSGFGQSMPDEGRCFIDRRAARFRHRAQNPDQLEQHHREEEDEDRGGREACKRRMNSKIVQEVSQRARALEDEDDIARVECWLVGKQGDVDC